MSSQQKVAFQTIDYVIFSIVLGVSAFIGMYYAIKRQCQSYCRKYYRRANGRKEAKSVSEIKEYLVASSSMSVFPVTLSLLATNFSGNVLLGFPAEIYQYGLQFFVACVGTAFTPLIGAFLTGPMFAALKVASVFEYFKLRYNSNSIRLIAVTGYFLRIVVSTAMYIFGPATTLNALSNINTVASILIIGSIAIFYTTIGGIKAVIWTDVFQISIMVTGMSLVIVKSTIDIGFDNIWRLAYEGGRVNFFDFDPNPLIRQSFWTLIFGHFFHFSMQYGIDQQMLQRFQSSKSKSNAKIAILLNIPGIVILYGICCFTGVIIYATYSKCDPLSDPSKIRNPNQLLPYLVSDRLAVINGAVGLFFASILSGALSSVSSTLNSLASILWEDLLKNFKFFYNMNDHHSTIVTKLLVVICGVLCTLLALFFTTTTGNIIQISGALNGAIAAPIVGLFALSALFASSNLFGACVGTLSGLALGMWLSVGQTIMRPEYQKLDVGIECYLNTTLGPLLQNTTNINYGTKMAWNLSGFNRIYSIAYMNLAILPTLVTIIIGLVASVLTGGHKQSVDGSLLLFHKSNKVDKENVEMIQDPYIVKL